MLLVNVLYFLVIFQASECYFKARIKMCSGKSLFKIAKGDSLELCCSLTEEACNMALANESLRLEHSIDTHGFNMIQIDRCNVTLIKKKVSLHDSGTYICYKNNQKNPPLYKVDVNILEKPQKVKNITAVYFERNSSLLIKFDKGPPSVQCLDDYELILEQKNDKIDQLNSNCTSNPEFYISIPKYLLVYNVTVKVNIFRPSKMENITSSHSKKTFDLYQHISPSSVVNLAIKHLNSSTATIQFTPSEGTKSNIRHMSNHGRPLSYKVILQKSSEDLKGIYLMVKFNQTLYWLKDRGKQNMAVAFQDLDPFTNYSVSVSSIGGGGESPFEVFNFTTKKSAPLRPPSLEPFSFFRAPYFNMPSDDKRTTCFYMLWKPLPVDWIGGDSLFYKIEVSGESTKIYESKENFLLKHLPLGPHHLKIWAVNEVGQSEHFSQISIPNYTDTDTAKIFVELDNAKADVFIYFVRDSLADQLAIHWCASGKGDICNNMDICKGSLHTHTEMLKMGKNLNYSVSLESFCKKLTCTKNKTVTYFDYENDDMINTSTANAHVRETMYIKDLEENSGFSNTSCLEHRERCMMEDTDAPAKLFFVSLKQKGTWNGMLPAHCYYHKNAKTVSLDLSHTIKRDKTKFLNIQQQCDPEPEPSRAKQYFPISFEIYTAPNRSCERRDLYQEKALAVIKNTNVFTPIIYELPPGLHYICVVALSQDPEKWSSKMYRLTDEPDETNTIFVVSVTIVLVVFVIVGIILLGCLMRRFVERKKYFAFLKEETSKSSSLLQIDVEKYAPEHSDDSGHGTFRDSNSQDSSSVARTSRYNSNSNKISPNDSGCSCGDPAAELLLNNSMQDHTAVKCTDISLSNNEESSNLCDSGQNSDSGRERGSEGTFESETSSSGTREEDETNSSSISTGNTGHSGSHSSGSSNCSSNLDDGYGENGLRFEKTAYYSD